MPIRHLLRAAWMAVLLFPTAVVAQDSTARPAADAPYRDARRSPAERARDLLARMTLDEKF
jgi:hypothetical protein